MADRTTCLSWLFRRAATVGVAGVALDGREVAAQCGAGLTLARGRFGSRPIADGGRLLGCAAALARTAQLLGMAAVDAPSAMALMLAPELVALGGIVA